MAVRENPYNKWLVGRENSDYRCTDTQVASLVRQQLSQSEYLRSANRVNPGPLKNKRAEIAKSSPQIPHVFGPMEMWGWQPWAHVVDTPDLNGLSEVLSAIDIPGATYYPYNRVGGATYVDLGYDRTPYRSNMIDVGAPMEISPRSYINGIPVDTNNLSPSTNNMVLVYRSDTKKFIFISARDLVGYSDNNMNPNDVDLGNF